MGDGYSQEDAYSQAVEVAEAHRTAYVTAASALLDCYETNDIQLFRFICLRLWNYANLGSQLAFEADKVRRHLCLFFPGICIINLIRIT